MTTAVKRNGKHKLPSRQSFEAAESRGRLPPGLISKTVGGDQGTRSWAEVQQAKAFAEQLDQSEDEQIEEAWRARGTGDVVFVACDLIHPHPKNRHTSDAEVAELAASIKEQGQQQPILVRVPGPHWGLPPEHVQIVFGERRWRACQAAGLEGVQAIVRTDLDDVEALELMATENAQRKDLSPIERAWLIKTLCEPVDEGGAGLTRDQAAKRVGLESGGAASNLVRLLELPKVWQDRVASGELPWTWAREIVPFVTLPPVLAALEKDWKERDTAEVWEENSFTSRANLQQELPALVDLECRRLDQERYTGGRYVRPKIDAKNPHIREQLGIVEVDVPRKGKLQRISVATNVKAFEELVKKQTGRADKHEAEKAGRDGPPEKRELTPAEKKQKVADRTRQRNERIAAWRHKLLRLACGRMIEELADNGERLILCYAADPCAPNDSPRLGRLLQEVLGRHPGKAGYRDNYWPVVCELNELADDQDLYATLAVRLLAHETNDWRRPTLPQRLVEQYAEDLGVDVADAWQSLQVSADGQLVGEALLEEFFLLHQTTELLDLIDEFKLHLLPSVKTRAQMVKFILAVPQGTTRRLPLPKSIKPLAGGKAKGRTKKGAK